jgi:23S rRNA (guanosine2251-2'-O)-methyltransferase
MSRKPGHRGDEPVWLFGAHAVKAALTNPRRHLRRLVLTRNAAREVDSDNIRIQPEIADPKAIDKLLPPGAVHQGFALLADPLPELALEDVCAPAKTGHPVVVLDQVSDPHNVGAILRTAAAFGARALVVQDRHAPPITGTLAKAASGAVEHVPIVRVTNIARAMEELAELGYWRVGLAGEAATALAEAPLDQPVVLALGAEGDGLRRLTRENCDLLARLPTDGPIASLNVSNAAAVALYEVSRQAKKD